MLESLIAIVGIDLALAADNAVIIGAITATVPAHQRKRVLIGGTAAAIVLRISATFGIVALLALPHVEMIGGITLLLVAAAVARAGASDDTAGTRKPRGMIGAIVAIAAADIALSVDNALAVAGAAHGSYVAVGIGLTLTVALLMFAGGYLARAIERAPWLMYAAAALIAAVGMSMIL